MKKRIMAALLAALLLIAFTGCGKKETVKKATDLCKLGQYKGIEVEKMVLEVSDDDVTRQIYSNLLTKLKEDATEDSLHVKVAEHDLVNIDFEGLLDGVAFSGGTAAGQDLVIGSGTFIPGFEEGLVGAEKGTTVVIDVTFPETYGNTELAGKPVKFRVTINSIKILPEFTDEYIADNTAYATLAEYQAYIRSTLEEQAAASIESNFKYSVVEKIIEGSTFDDTLQADIDKYVQDEMSYYENIAKAQYGIELETLVMYFYGETLEQFKAEIVEQATFMKKVERILNSIVEIEQITVSDEEYTTYAKSLAADNGFESVEALETQATKEVVMDSCKQQKAQDIIFNSAVAK